MSIIYNRSTDQFVDDETGEVKKYSRKEKARLLEIEAQKEKERQQVESGLNGVSQEKINDTIETIGQATGQNFKLVQIKKRWQDRIAFSQIIHPNVEYLTEIKYLTDAELAFLFKVAPMLEFGSNCLIIRDAFDVEGLELSATPSPIADRLEKDRTGISRLMNGLFKKGVLGTGESGTHVVVERDGVKFTRPVTPRTWFMNPNIICCADKGNVDKATQRIFMDVLVNFVVPNDPAKEIHNLPIRLFASSEEIKAKQQESRKKTKEAKAKNKPKKS